MPVPELSGAGTVVSVLVDADNVPGRLIQPVLELIRATPAVRFRVVASGRRAALAGLSWPDGTLVIPDAGWQRADLALARAYRPAPEPLILVTGDGDFGLLAARHPGPVLVVSTAASGRLRQAAVVVNPARQGITPIAQWLQAVTRGSG